MAADHVHPSPGFEGSEKRVEADFSLGAAAPANGLRALTRSQLDGLMDLAACCIVSTRSNASFDAYVLSESSLFVYPTKFVLKTCGTTKLLNCVPTLLQLAAELDMLPGRCKFSRASFLFPECQPELHSSFEAEVAFLRSQFGHLGDGGSAYVLGDALRGLQWHTFVADAAHGSQISSAATHTLEVCMTGLDPAKAAQFFRDDSFVSAAQTTIDSGIRALVPGADIDDYVFEPCGYSMNGIDGQGFVTIHITPEPHCSYASVELCNYPAASLDPSALVAQIAAIFQPAQLSVALSVDTGAAACPSWGAGLALPPQYRRQGASAQAFADGGRVAYFTLARQGAALAALSSTAKAAASDSEASSQPGSPRTVLKTVTSFATTLSSADDDARSTSTDEAAPDGDSAGAAAAGSAAPALAEGPAAAPFPSGSGLDSPAARTVLARFAAAPLPCGGACAVDAFAAAQIAAHELEDTFYVLDLGAVARLHAAWRAALPRVEPFYAVKCNPDAGLVAMLAALGAGFDCASKAEVDAVTRLGVAPERIIYANSCKKPSDLRGAASAGVALTTFDTLSEVEKLARWHPECQAVLRIRADDPKARCQLGNKYGAERQDCARLLAAARRARLAVVGVSFHIGSGGSNADAFVEAIGKARSVFDEASQMGFDMSVLDIGGGFPGGMPSAVGAAALGDVPAAVNAALDRHFPASCGVRIIAEPGRYFAEGAATLALQVFGHRPRPKPGAGTPDAAFGEDAGDAAFDYYVTDGLYGSLNCVMYDHATPTARPLASPLLPALPEAGRTHSSTVFGPTCDGLDKVLDDVQLPRLRNGDWLLFPNMGAYALAGASNFNGMNATDVRTFYVASHQ